MMLRSACLVLFLAGLAAQAHAQPLRAPDDRDAALVVTTPGFRFHSDFWINLHDYLHGLVGGGPGDVKLEPEGTGCIGALPAAQSDGWNAAVRHYETDMAERHHRRDPLVSAVRYHFAEGVPVDYAPFDSLMAVFEGAAPAYQACLWPGHDARNRVRIEELTSMIGRHGSALTERLGTLYQATWPEGVTVDVSSYASYAGANTATGGGEFPPHMMISSLDSDLGGYSGLELLFHEASHSVFGGSHGRVSAALDAAADSLGVEMPRALWHAVSFHTSGWAVQQEAAAAGVGYEPYWLRNNVFASYHDAIRAHWQPYLDGTATMDEAALALVRALTSE